MTAAEERQVIIAKAVEPHLDKLYNVVADLQTKVNKGDVSRSDTAVLRAYEALNEVIVLAKKAGEALAESLPEFYNAFEATRRVLDLEFDKEDQA